MAKLGVYRMPFVTFKFTILQSYDTFLKSCILWLTSCIILHIYIYHVKYIYYIKYIYIYIYIYCHSLRCLHKWKFTAKIFVAVKKFSHFVRLIQRFWRNVCKPTLDTNIEVQNQNLSLHPSLSSSLHTSLSSFSFPPSLSFSSLPLVLHLVCHQQMDKDWEIRIDQRNFNDA